MSWQQMALDITNTVKWPVAALIVLVVFRREFRK